jgi:GMP synthase-like glutamine amidotransferase
MQGVSQDELRGVVLRMQATAPAGLLEGWAKARGIALDVIAVDDGPLPPPDADRHAFAVVLGSGKSLAADLPPWAPGVLDWLRAADAACLPVLGICFAAPEIGWIEVETSDAERIPSGPWMAWHEDGLEPPPLAYELASNAVGTQAFCLRRHLAVQFHPEVTPDIVEGWATSPTSRLGATGQTVAGLRELSEEHAPGAAQRAERLFDGFAARAGIQPRVPR